MTELLLHRAALLATRAHQNQRRDFTGEPYIIHPAAVAEIVAQTTGGEYAVAAAWLHDVLEDTDYTRDDMVRYGIPEDVIALVHEVTGPIPGKQGIPREVRVATNDAHYIKASPAGQTIKLADIFNNVQTLATRDTKFARKYLPEKLALAKSLINPSSPTLRTETISLIESELARLEPTPPR